MKRNAFVILFACCLLRSLCWSADKEVVLDTFEAANPAWVYSNGPEFPGAEGYFQRLTGIAHSGSGSAQLIADFRAGGRYVVANRDLLSLNQAAASEFRFWIAVSNITSVFIRVEDATGQTHQSRALPLTSPGWQEVRSKIADIVGHGSWGGANDRLWHGPARRFGVLIDVNAVGSSKQAILLLDDVRAMVPGTTVIPTISTLHGALLSQSATRPGYGVQVTYRWDGVPLSMDYKVFVHAIGPTGTIAFQGDHDLPIPTSAWTGRVQYTDGLSVPPGTPTGDYRIVAGLWNPATGARPALLAGQGATSAGTGACQIGTFRVAPDGPLPALGTPTLNLSGYRLTFDEDFALPTLSVSAWGPGTRWIAHTPFNEDFGDAQFADPQTGFPFTVANGLLRIEARRTNGVWKSGLLSSVDALGRGFSQRFGYFEMRAKLPKGEGVWPAFWLMGVRGLTDDTITNIEIDVLEQYGARPNTLFTSQHFWGPGDVHQAEVRKAIVPGMTDGFHRYGVMINESYLIFYYDGVELRRVPTPPEARVPVYPLVDLALGGGWPITNTPSPSYLYVDYIRVYAKP